MFCNRDVYAQEFLDRRSLQLRGIHARAGSASRKSISKYNNYLKPYFDYDFSDTRSSQIAHDFQRYIKETRKHKKETPSFVEDVLNKILFLHKYNLKVAEVTFKYPLTKNFKQLLLHYIVLQCNVLYKRGCYPPEHEGNIEAKLIRLLLNIYHSYYESLMSTSAAKLEDETIKAVLGLLVRIKTEYDMQNKLIENIVIKLLNKNGKLEELTALQKTYISCPLDNDPSIRNSCKNIITSDYGTDDDLKIDDDCVQVDSEELDSNDDNVDVDIKPDVDNLIIPFNKLQQNQDNTSTKVPTIYIDDDDVQMVCWEEEAKKSNKSLKREEEEKQKDLVRREKYNEAFTNHKPMLYISDVKEEVIDLVLSSEDELDSQNDINRNNNIDSVISNTEKCPFLNENITDNDEMPKSDLPVNNKIDLIDKISDNTINEESDEELFRIGESSKAKTNKTKLFESYCKHKEEQDLPTSSNYNAKRNLFATSSNLPEMIQLEEGDSTLTITKETVEERNVPSEFINENNLQENYSTSKIYEENELESFESYYVIEASKVNRSTGHQLINPTTQDQYKVQPMLEISSHNERFSQDMNDENNLQNKNALSVIKGNNVKIALNQTTTNNATKVHAQYNADKSVAVNFVEEMQTNKINAIELVLNQQTPNKSYHNIEEDKCAEVKTKVVQDIQANKIATCGSISEEIESNETRGLEKKSLKVKPFDEGSADQVLNLNLNQIAANIILSKSPSDTTEICVTTAKSDSVGTEEPVKVNEISKKSISDKQVSNEKFISESTSNCEVGTSTRILCEEICASGSELWKDTNDKAKEMPLAAVYEKDKNNQIETSQKETTDQEAIRIREHKEKVFTTNKSTSPNKTLTKNNTSEDVNPIQKSKDKKASVIEKLFEQSSYTETEQLCNLSEVQVTVEAKHPELCNKNDIKISKIFDDTVNGNVTLADKHNVKNTEEPIEQSSKVIPIAQIQFDGISNLIDNIPLKEKHELAEENQSKELANNEQYVQKVEINQSSPDTSRKTFEVQNKLLTTDKITVGEQVFEETFSNVSKNSDYSTDNESIKQELELLDEEEPHEISTDDTETSFKRKIDKLERKSDISILEPVDQYDLQNEDAELNKQEISYASCSTDKSEKDVEQNVTEKAIIKNLVETIVDGQSEAEKNLSSQKLCEETNNDIATSLEGDVEEIVKESTTFTKESIKESIQQNIDILTDDVIVKERVIETIIEEKERISPAKSVQDTSIENESTDQSIETVNFNENIALTGEIIEEVNRPRELETLNNDEDISKKCTENTEGSFVVEIDRMEKKSSVTEKSIDDINLYQEINVDVSSNDAKITSTFLDTDMNEQSVIEENIALNPKVGVEEKCINLDVEVLNNDRTDEEVNLILAQDLREADCLPEPEKVSNEEICEELTEDTAGLSEKFGQISQEEFIEVTESSKIIEEENSEITEVINKEISLEDRIRFEELEPNKLNSVEPNSSVQLTKEVTTEDMTNLTKLVNMEIINTEMGVCKEVRSEHEDSSKNQFLINVSTSFEDNENEELNTNKSKTEDSFENLHEDPKGEFMNELNIQMEEIITETSVFDANISEQMVAEVTIHDGISQIINPTEIHSENKELISNQIISRTIPTPAISLNASDSLLEKIDALKKIGTEILFAQNDERESEKIVQSLEICEIPNENTFLDILATVASEVPRQNLVKTKRTKKGTRRLRKKHNMSKSKCAVKKSKQTLKVEPSFNRKCKPHDFFLVSNSDVPPPANNVYTHKLPDITVTSEDSNDSEGNLLIDEDVDTKNNKHSKEIMEESKVVGCDLKQTDTLTVYDEDTFEENITFAYESRVKGAVLISIPDNDQENFDILKQMEEMELCSSNNLGNITGVRGSITKKNNGVHENISDNINPNIKKDFSITDVETNEKDVDEPETNRDLNGVLTNTVYEKEMNDHQLPLENRNVVINTFKPLRSWKPIRTMAERKDYDKFKFNPYVSIERLNFCCKMEKEEKCKRTRSKSFDIGIIRNSDRTYLDASDPQVVSLNVKNIDVDPKSDSEYKPYIQESFHDVSNISRNSESESTFSSVSPLKSSTHYMSDDNLPLAKLKKKLESESHNKQEIDVNNLDNIPLLLRKRINSGESQCKKYSPRNVKQKKAKAGGQKTEKNQMFDQNINKSMESKDEISETNVTVAFKRKIAFDKPNDVIFVNTSDDIILSETNPTAIAEPVAKEYSAANTESNSRTELGSHEVTSPLTNDNLDKKDNSVLPLVIEHNQDVASNSENELTLFNKTLTKSEKDNNEDTAGNSNRKYYTTPKFRRKSMSRDNLNRIEGNSLDSLSLKSTTTGEKDLSLNTNKKYYAPPKFRRKSVVKSENIFVEDSARKTTPKQINSKIDILSKCKNTVSPTTEKLKKKLEIEFKLNCNEIKFEDDIPKNLDWSATKSTVSDSTMVESTNKETDDQLKNKHIISRGKSKQKSRNTSKSMIKNEEHTATSANQTTKENYDISTNALNEQNAYEENIEIDSRFDNDGNVLNEDILERSVTYNQQIESAFKSESVQNISNKKKVEIESSEVKKIGVDSESNLEIISKPICNEDTDKSETLIITDISTGVSFKCPPVYEKKSKVILEDSCGREKCENISDRVNIKLNSPKRPESLLLNPSLTPKKIKKINKKHIQQIENSEHLKSLKVKNEKLVSKLQIQLPDEDVQEESLELQQINRSCIKSGDKNGTKSVAQSKDEINDLDNVPLLERALRFIEPQDINIKQEKKIKGINKKNRKNMSVTSTVMKTKTQKNKKRSKADANKKKENIKTHKEETIEISENIQNKNKLNEDNSNAELVSQHTDKKIGNNQNSSITLATNKHQPNDVDSFEINNKNPVTKLPERARQSHARANESDNVKNNKDTSKLYDNKTSEKAETDGKKSKKVMNIDKQSKNKDIKKNEQTLKIDRTSKETKKSNMDKLKTTLIQTRSNDYEIFHTMEPDPTLNMSLRKNNQTISTSETISSSVSKAHALDIESKRKGHDTKLSEQSNTHAIKKYDKSKSSSNSLSLTSSKGSKSKYDKKQKDGSKKYYKSDSRSNSDSSSPSSKSDTSNSEYIYERNKNDNKSKSRSSSVSSRSSSSKCVTPNILEKERQKRHDQGRSKSKHDHSQARSSSKISQSSISTSDRHANKGNDDKKSIDIRSNSTSEKVCKPIKTEVKADVSKPDNIEKRNKISAKEKRKKDKEESHTYSEQTDTNPSKRRKIQKAVSHANKYPENVACSLKICSDGNISKPIIKQKKDAPKPSKAEDNLVLSTECTPVNLECECQRQDFLVERNKIIENEDALAINEESLKKEVVELKSHSEEETNSQKLIEKAISEGPLLSEAVQQYGTISESLSGVENMTDQNIQKTPAKLDENLKEIIEDKGAAGLEKSCTNLESAKHSEINDKNTSKYKQNLEAMEAPKNTEGNLLTVTDNSSKTMVSEMIAIDVEAPKLLIADDIINGEKSLKIEENLVAVGQEDTSEVKSVNDVNEVIEATEPSIVEVNKDSTSIPKQNSMEILNNQVAQVTEESGSKELMKDYTKLELLIVDKENSKNSEKTSKLEHAEELEKDNIYFKNDNLSTLSEEKCEIKNQEVAKCFTDSESLNVDVNEEIHKLQLNSEEIDNNEILETHVSIHDKDLSSTCSEEITKECIKLPSVNLDEENNKASIIERISEKIKEDKIEPVICPNNKISKISDEKCLEGIAKDFTSSERLSLAVDESNSKQASKLERNSEKIQIDQITEISSGDDSGHIEEKNLMEIKDKKLEKLNVLDVNSKKTGFKLEQNSETVKKEQMVQADSLHSIDSNLNHTEMTKVSKTKSSKSTSEVLPNTELLSVGDLNEKNVEIHFSEDETTELIVNTEILKVSEVGKDTLSKVNLETKNLEEVANDCDTNLDNNKKEVDIFVNNYTTNETTGKDSETVKEQKEKAQAIPDNEMEQSKERVCAVAKSVEFEREKRVSNAQLQGTGPTCLVVKETAVQGYGKEISEATNRNAENKQNKNITVTSVINCVNSRMSKLVPEVKSKKICGREVKLKNIEDAFEQYLPTKPKEIKETEAKTDQANATIKIEDKSNCPVNYTSLCPSDGNDQSINKKRKLNVLDLEESIPASDIPNRKTLLEEINIDVSGETQLNNNKTQISPLSTSPRKKERKSIEVIINNLKGEKSSATVLNEDDLKDQSNSSDDGVDVSKLRSKLSQKIKSTQQPTSPVKELLQIGTNNIEQTLIAENIETAEVVSDRSKFNNSQTEDDNTQCDMSDSANNTLEFSRETGPIVEASRDGINYLCKEFIPVTQTNPMEFNVEQKSDVPILVDDSKMLVLTAKDSDNDESVTTPKESNCNENSVSTMQSSIIINDSLSKKHDIACLEKEEIIESSLNDVIESSFIDDSLNISSLENNAIGSLDPPTNRESPNLLNLSDLIMHGDSASTDVTDIGEITVSPAAVCMFPDIISTTINSSDNKMSCSSPTGTTKLFTYPVASQADMTEEFIPLNEVSGNDNFLDDANASTGKVGSLHESCVFSFNEQIDNPNHRTLSSPGLDLNLQYVPFSNIPIGGSSQSLDLISPKSLSMVQTSRSNNYMNDVPVDNEINDIVTEIPCSSEPDDHNYTLGGPLLSGRPKEENKSICPTNFDKPLDDSPNEFSLNDTQLQEFVFSENNLREIMPEDTYKLNLDNEYAVKNLVILGSQTTTDTNAFPLSNYNLADIERINLIECSISNSEENSNSKEYLDSTSSSLEQDTENTSSNTNPWAEFIVNENPNQKVVVLSNECLTPAFSIAQNDLIKSFADKAVESEKTIESITPISSSNSLSPKPSKPEVPKKEVALGISKINLRRNRKSVSERPAQNDNILNDFLPKRRYSKTIAKRKSGSVPPANETKKEITVENPIIPQVNTSNVMLKDLTPQANSLAMPDITSMLSEKSMLKDDTPLLNLNKLNQINPKQVPKISVESCETSSNKRPVGSLLLETKGKSPSQSYVSPIRDVPDNQSVKIQNLTIPCISANINNPCEDLLQTTSISLSKVAELDIVEVSGNMQKKADKRPATSRYSNNYTPPTIFSIKETSAKTEIVKPTKPTSFDMPLLEDGMSNNGVNESKIDLLQPVQECKNVSAQPHLQVQNSPAESTLAKLVPSNLTKPFAELEGKGKSSRQTRSNSNKNLILGTLDIPSINAVNLSKSKEQLTECDLLPNKPVILPTTPAEPRKSSTSKYNYSIDSILSKGPKPCANNYKCENPVKDYRQPNNRGVKRSSSTVEDERETGNVDNKKLRKLDGNGPQPTSSKDATFDELLQQGNVNRLISLRVTEDNKLKPERRSSPSITKSYNRNKDQNEREDKLKPERRNSPLAIKSHSRNKEQNERQNNKLKPEKKNSPLVMKSYPKNRETQSERGLNNSYIHPGYDRSRVNRRGEVEENRSETRRAQNPYQPPHNINKTSGRENRLTDSNRVREGYNSDYIQTRSRDGHHGYSKGKECHQSDHSRGRGRQHYGCASTSAQSSNNPQPTSSRSSNVSELYYSNPMSKHGTQHVDPSNTAAYQTAGPYSKRNAKMSEDKLNALLNSVKDRVLDQLGGTDRRRHKEEGEYSWIEKFNQRIQSDSYLLGATNASTPQFFPKMPSP